jgi:Rps23 Pro-64 3,4-dihydroxylase Tpa1-like proline 4-hydroxylase
MSAEASKDCDWPPAVGQIVERGFDDTFWLKATVSEAVGATVFTLLYEDGTEEEGVALGELRDPFAAGDRAADEKRTEAHRKALSALSSLCSVARRKLHAGFSFWSETSAMKRMLDPAVQLKLASDAQAAARKARVESILGPLLSQRDSLVNVVSRLENNTLELGENARQAVETLDSTTDVMNSAREDLLVMTSVVADLLAGSTGPDKPSRGLAQKPRTLPGIAAAAMALNDSVPPITFVDGAVSGEAVRSLRLEMEQLWARCSSGLDDQLADNHLVTVIVPVPDPADALLVAQTCDVTIAEALRCLEQNNNCLVSAVVSLSPSFHRGTVDGSTKENTGRSDYVIWLDGSEKHAPPALSGILSRIDSIVLHQLAPLISGVLGGATLIKPVKAMLSCYPGKGAHYHRHCDNVDGSNGRRLAAILYLNEGWEPRHGGCLRASASMDADSMFLDVEPIMGRLVLFICDERVPHEVLPSLRPRFAVTVWYEEDLITRLGSAAKGVQMQMGVGRA